MDFTKICDQFEKHGFSCKLFTTGTEAVAYLTETLKGRSIGFGGSATLRELGLFEALSEENAVVWHNRHVSAEVRRWQRVLHHPANAVTSDGKIVNIDGPKQGGYDQFRSSNLYLHYR